MTITTFRRVLESLLATAAISPYPAAGQAGSCTRGPLLPAYAHNDYTNSHPLHDALQLGFRGVEADVLLRGGELRVALVRLVSLDYGKTIGWAGRLSRAYNVPVDPAVYRLLLEAGADLIGTKHLQASQRVLRTVGPAFPR